MIIISGLKGKNLLFYCVIKNIVQRVNHNGYRTSKFVVFKNTLMTIYSPNISRLVGVNSQQYKHIHQSLSQYLTTKKQRPIAIAKFCSGRQKKITRSWNKSYSLKTGRINKFIHLVCFYSSKNKINSNDFLPSQRNFQKYDIITISKTDECEISFHNIGILDCPCCSLN